jgi:hypothetical protein
MRSLTSHQTSTARLREHLRRHSHITDMAVSLEVTSSHKALRRRCSLTGRRTLTSILALMDFRPSMPRSSQKLRRPTVTRTCHSTRTNSGCNILLKAHPRNNNNNSSSDTTTLKDILRHLQHQRKVPHTPNLSSRKEVTPTGSPKGQYPHRSIGRISVLRRIWVSKDKPRGMDHLGSRACRAK